MKILKRMLLLLFAILGGGALWTYSWTFTPQGRLDFPAAVIARASAWGDQDLVLDPATVASARVAANDQLGSMLRRAPVVAGVSISELQLDGPAGPVRLRHYRPDQAGKLPALLWIHGGGFWMGDKLEDWDGRVTPLARDAGIAIFSVDYRLAPEHPWPAAVEDSYAALLWLSEQADALGIDRDRLAVGGGSAGGNLSAVVALKARDENGPALAAQLLTVPATDASPTRYPSDDLFAEGYVLTDANLQTMLAAYLPNPEDRMHPYASPILAPSHADLPPALIITAQYDPLRDEGEAYGEKLRTAGVPAEVIRFDGTIHGLMGSSAASEQAHRAQVAMLRRIFRH